MSHPCWQEEALVFAVTFYRLPCFREVISAESCAAFFPTYKTGICEQGSEGEKKGGEQ